jgi:hypothetical protein
MLLTRDQAMKADGTTGNHLPVNESDSHAASTVRWATDAEILAYLENPKVKAWFKKNPVS